MIGKIISDRFGITKFFGGTVNKKISFETEVDVKELDKLQTKIATLDGDKIRIRAAVDESSLKDIDGLADYAVDRAKQGKNISKEGVTELLHKNIASQAKGFSGVNAAINEYNKLTDTAARSNFADVINSTNSSLGKYLTGLNGTKAGIFSYGRSLVNATAKTVAFNAVMGIMNMAVNIGFSALVSYVITGLDKLIVTTDEAREASRNFIKSVMEFNDTSAANSKRIAELNDRYKELSNGISSSGNNVSLTNDEYNEYKDIISEVSDMMPNLTAKYNAQGEKIGFAKGKLDDLTESYKKYQQEVAKNFVNGTSDDGSLDSAIINFKNQDNYSDGNGDFLSSSHLSEGWEFLKTAYAPHITDNSEMWGNKEKVRNLRAMLNLSKEEMIDYMSGWFDSSAHVMEDLLGFDEDEMEEMTENEIHDAIRTVLEKYEAQIDESYEQLKTGIHEYLKSKDNFWEFDENEQNNVLNFISLLPNSIFPEIGINTDDSVQIIKTKLSEFSDEIFSQMQNDNGFKNAFEEIMTFDPEQSDKKLAGLYGYMEKQAEIVANGLGISTETVYQIFRDNYYEQIEGAFQKGMNILSDYPDKYDDLVNLPLSDLMKINELEVPEGTLLSWDELIAEIREVQDSTLNKNPTSFTDVISQVQSLSDGFNQLGKIYADISDKEADWSSMLNNEEFKRVFSGFTNEYDSFIKTVSNAPDDIDACQSAFDDLATAYINSSDVMENLTEETKDAATGMLNQMGIANAEEVVTEALARKKAQLAAQEFYNINVKQKNISVSENNIDSLLSEAALCGISEKAYASLLAQEIMFNNNSLDVTDKLQGLSKIAQQAGLAAIETDRLNTVMNGVGLKESFAIENGIDVIKTPGRTTKNKKGETVPDWQYRYNDKTYESLDDAYLDKKYDELMARLNTPVEVSYEGPSNKKKAIEDSEKAAKESVETFDWIETAIKRVSTALGHLKERADNTYSSWASRNENLQNAIASTRQSIDLQAQAYQRYMAQAESVPLPAAWKNVVQNGAIDISMISDETLTENIREYQTWYDKAQDCLNTQQELNKSLNELESHRFTNLQTEYESLTELMETQKSLLEGQITVLSNGADYDRLRGQQNNILTNLRNERSVLEATLNSLSIERGTEEWNNLQSAVTKTSQSIQDAEKSLREINRMQFDNLKEFYESSISLMEKQKDNAQNRITLLSGSGDYESLKRQQQNIISGYEEELKKLNALKNSAVFSGMSYEDRMGVLSDLEDITGSLDDARNALKEISKLRFDNIKETLEFEKSSLEHLIKMDEERIRLAETKGLFSDTRYHTDKKRLTEQELSKTRKEIQQLEIVRDTSGYEIGTSEWNSMTSEIMSLREQELSLTTQVEEVKNAIRDLDWEVFDTLAESVNDLTSESGFLTDLMEYGKLIDDKGKFTDEGNASLALNLVNADISKQQSESYFAEAAEIEKELKRGSGKEMLSRYNELIEKGRESLLAYKGSLKDAVSLIEERYQAELDALQKLIDKKKEQMQEEKNLYDYQKSIREKTDNIASLEKQKSAYTNDNSEETMARIQRIQLELKEAKEDLQEAEYEKYLSDSQDMLDKLAEDYENWMNIRLDNQEALIREIAANVNNTGAEIQQTLRSIAEENGFKLSEYMGQILGSLNVLSERLVPGTGEENIQEPDYTDAQTKLDKALNLIENPEGYRLEDAHEALIEADAKYQQNTASGTEQAVASKRQEYMDNAGLLPANLEMKDVRIILKKALNLLPNEEGYTLADAGKALAIALNLTKGYKTGTSYVPKTGLYQTQEDGSEIILSKTRGMLTPLEQGDMVLTAEQSQHVFDFAKNPSAFINAASPKTTSAIQRSNLLAQPNINNIGDIHIELPDVKDYDEFRAKLVKDKTFENAMCTMVNNSIMGKSTIDKRKYL